jgi:hypothetical protein
MCLMAYARVCDKCGKVENTPDNWNQPAGWVELDVLDMEQIILCPACFNEPISNLIKLMKPLPKD